MMDASWGFEIAEILRGKFLDSVNEELDGIFRQAGMNIPVDVAQSITGALEELFSHDPKNPAGVALKRPKESRESRGWGGRDCGNGGVLYNVFPSTNMTNILTDTLLVYCLGSDDLKNRLLNALYEVRKHQYKNVIFLTSKWDISAVTGRNADKLLELYELMKAGTKFNFVLVSTSGISRIPVL